MSEMHYMTAETHDPDEGAIERDFIMRNFPHVLDMACMMICAGLRTVEQHNMPATAMLNFTRNPDQTFHFSWQVTAHDTKAN